VASGINIYIDGLAKAAGKFRKQSKNPSGDHDQVFPLEISLSTINAEIATATSALGHNSGNRYAPGAVRG
jgi:hypothetical protein